MESKNGKEISVPKGINLRVSGSNIEFASYLLLIRRVFDAVDIKPDYFTDPHPYSNVQDAERYVRLHRRRVAQYMPEMGRSPASVTCSKTTGVAIARSSKDDQNERGETLSGYYHTRSRSVKSGFRKRSRRTSSPKRSSTTRRGRPNRSLQTTRSHVRRSARRIRSVGGTGRSVSRPRKSISSLGSWTRRCCRRS